MAKTYTVNRAHAAATKGGGEVWLTRENEHRIPELLSTQAIRDRVKSGALEEHDDGEPEVPEELATAVEETAPTKARRK
jgi:hypothetical protein